MNYEYNKQWDYYVRPSPYDKMDIWTFKELKYNYKPVYPLLKDKIVLDVGAHIGVFSKFALDNGAAKVVAYEPVKENYDVLYYNLADRVVCMNSGIGPEDSEVDFYLSTGTCTTTHSMMPIKSHKRKKTSIKVKSFTDVLNKVKPDVLKWDAEGAELFVIDELCNLPNCVKVICIEVSNYIATRKRLGIPDSEIYRLRDGLYKQFKKLALYPTKCNSFDDVKHNEACFIGVR